MKHIYLSIFCFLINISPINSFAGAAASESSAPPNVGKPATDTKTDSSAPANTTAVPNTTGIKVSEPTTTTNEAGITTKDKAKDTQPDAKAISTSEEVKTDAKVDPATPEAKTDTPAPTTDTKTETDTAKATAGATDNKVKDIPVEKAEPADESDRAFYIGVDGGISLPTQHKLKYKKADLTVKSIPFYQAKIGYKFYPNMNIEFAFSRLVKQKTLYNIPSRYENVPSNRSHSKINSNIYMVNLVYDLLPFYPGCAPYVVGGIGMAQYNLSSKYLSNELTNYYKITNKKQNTFVWQIGLGVTQEITPNIYLDLGARLKVLHKVGIRYQAFDQSHNNFIKAYHKKHHIKSGELTFGLLFKLPFKAK